MFEERQLRARVCAGLQQTWKKGKEREGGARVRVRVATCLSEGRET